MHFRQLKLFATLLLLQVSLGTAAYKHGHVRNELHNAVEKRVSGYQNAAYYGNWDIYGTDYQPQQLPASQLSYLLYAFANLQANGTVYSSDTYADLENHYSTDSWNDVGNNAYGCVKQLYLLKKANRNMKVLLSIGGATYSTNFAAAASTAMTRATFASTAVTLIKDWGFDGIDIDWEAPASATEAANFVLLLQAVRSALDTYAAQYAPGYHFILTIASPADPTDYDMLELKDMSTVIDYFNFMGYDYSGSWSAVSSHQANLYANPSNPGSTPFNSDTGINDYISSGVPPAQILLGMPIFGQSFEATTGLGEVNNGVGNGSWNYNLLPRAGAIEVYDSIAGASYSYDNSTQELISYDNVLSVQKKVAYLQGLGLGGSMFWEVSEDRNDTGSLINTSYEALGSLAQSNNLLSYPDSQYANIAAGMVQTLANH